MEFKGKKFGLISTVIALVIILLSPLLPPPFSLIGEGIGLVVLIVAGVVIWRHWRCPHCNACMPIRGIYEPEYCPACGKRMHPYE